MGFLSWLFKSKINTDKKINGDIKSSVSHISQTQKKPSKPRRSKEVIEAESAQQHAWLIEKKKLYAENEKNRQLSVGITRYKWSSSGDERTCAACAANSGKIFHWNNPPKTGHPGEGHCCQDDEGYCRCIALPIE
jgi:hypothetical protein